MRTEDLSWVVPAEQTLFAGDPPWNEEMFAAELAEVPATRWYMVAVDDDGAPLGWVGLWFTQPDFVDLQTLAVLDGHQRRGIGTVLLRAALAEAESRGVRRMLLEVRVDNDAALALYRREGFERLIRRRGYYGAGRYDGLVMRRVMAGGQ
ncbi:MAG TPA: ribosomal protein S18-alanine N-acetyltransferase [Jiangellaceae bacterium]|nr:ribosomal protein S18-alanine N-acetyltransferase [Jiangellaceae bacterium]